MKAIDIEAQDRICEKCGREFTSVAETDDDYKNWCNDCYKQMIYERFERDEDI